MILILIANHIAEDFPHHCRYLRSIWLQLSERRRLLYKLTIIQCRWRDVFVRGKSWRRWNEKNDWYVTMTMTTMMDSCW